MPKPLSGIETRITGDLATLLATTSAQLGLPQAEIVEAALEATLRPTTDAATATNLDRTLTTQADYTARLSPITDQLVTAVRLPAAGQPGVGSTGVWADTSDPASLWYAARGPWVINERTRIVIPFRYGIPIGNLLFVITAWTPTSRRGQKTAKDGYTVQAGRRFHPATGTPMGAASAEERGILAAIAGTRLFMPARAHNPIVILHSDRPEQED